MEDLAPAFFPIPDRDFDASELRAKLDALLVLTAAIHPERLSLYRSSVAWHRHLSDLGKAFEDQVDDLTQPQQVLEIWGTFTASIRVARESEDFKAALARIGKAIDDRLRSGAETLEYLAAAHERAYHGVGRMMSGAGLADLAPDEPADCVVVWDKEASRSCTSSRLARSIVWPFQPRSFALWGALAADRVLAHEYLSHFIPRSSAELPRLREGWLMEALLYEIRNDPGPDRSVDRYATTFFLSRLAEAQGRDFFTGVDSLRTTTQAIRLQSPHLFWRLTGEILRLPNEEVGRIEGLLLRLSQLRMDDLGKLAREGALSSLASLAISLDRLS